MVVADKKLIYADTVEQNAGSPVDAVKGFEDDWAGTISLIQRMLAKFGVPGYPHGSA